MSRQDMGELLQNVMQSKGEESLNTGACCSGRPDLSIRWGEKERKKEEVKDKRKR